MSVSSGGVRLRFRVRVKVAVVEEFFFFTEEKKEQASLNG